MCVCTWVCGEVRVCVVCVLRMVGGLSVAVVPCHACWQALLNDGVGRHRKERPDDANKGTNGVSVGKRVAVGVCDVGMRMCERRVWVEDESELSGATVVSFTGGEAFGRGIVDHHSRWPPHQTGCMGVCVVLCG